MSFDVRCLSVFFSEWHGHLHDKASWIEMHGSRWLRGHYAATDTKWPCCRHGVRDRAKRVPPEQTSTFTWCRPLLRAAISFLSHSVSIHSTRWYNAAARKTKPKYSGSCFSPWSSAKEISKCVYKINLAASLCRALKMLGGGGRRATTSVWRQDLFISESMRFLLLLYFWNRACVWQKKRMRKNHTLIPRECAVWVHWAW